MTLAEALKAVSEDARVYRRDGSDGFIDVCASAKSAVLTEVPVSGGVVRVTYVPDGAADPVAVADETIKRLQAAAGAKVKGT